MKYIKHKPSANDFLVWFLILVLLVGVPVLSGYYPDNEVLGLPLAVLILLGFFLFNLIVRRNPNFKGYLTSKYNILTSKNRSEHESDIPIDLMFDKIKEVLEQSSFKLSYADKSKKELMATTGMSWTSWGENIYINFDTVEGKTRMHFCSTTFFQVTSWGRNDRNIEGLIQEIEESLTI